MNPNTPDVTAVNTTAGALAGTILTYAITTGNYVPQAFLAVALIAIAMLAYEAAVKWARNGRVRDVTLQELHNAAEAVAAGVEPAPEVDLLGVDQA